MRPNQAKIRLVSWKGALLLVTLHLTDTDTFKSQRVYLYLKKSDSIDKNIIATLKLDRNTIRLTKTISLKDYVAASFLPSDG